MELAWTHNSDHEDEPRPEGRVAGNVWTFGPIVAGKFRYIRADGGGFMFVSIRGTRLGLNWEW